MFVHLYPGSRCRNLRFFGGEKKSDSPVEGCPKVFHFAMHDSVHIAISRYRASRRCFEPGWDNKHGTWTIFGARANIFPAHDDLFG